jgi:hypothetical protein
LETRSDFSATLTSSFFFLEAEMPLEETSGCPEEAEKKAK